MGGRYVYSAQMDKPIKIGIIGGGMIAQVCHIPFLMDDVRCEVKTIAESRPSLITHLKQTYDFENITPDYMDILNDPEIEGVVISGPRAANGPLALETLRAGKHVFAEKPMTHSLEQSSKPADIAASKGLIYAIGFMKRYDEGVIEAKRLLADLIDTERFGTLTEARFYDHSRANQFPPPAHQRPLESRTQRFETWPLWPEWMPEAYQEHYSWFMNVASHDINLMHYFFNTDLEVLSTSLSEDGSLETTLKKDSIPIHFAFSKTETDKWAEGVEFIFEKGRMHLAIPCPMDVQGTGRITLYDQNGAPNVHNFADEHKWSFKHQAHGFISALAKDEEFKTLGKDGLHDMDCIERIWKKGLESTSS